jgi:hypothetical protein
MKLDYCIILMNLSDVIRLHDMAIARFGGASGIRDIGLLESAINQPEMMIYYIEMVLMSI